MDIHHPQRDSACAFRASFSRAGFAFDQFGFLQQRVFGAGFHALSLSLVTSSITTSSQRYSARHWHIAGALEIQHKSWLELILDLPIVLPPSVAGLALLIAFGRRGLFGSVLSFLGISLPFTTAAVILAQTFVAAPLFVRSARIGFAQIDLQLEESAHVEGANQWQLFLRSYGSSRRACPRQAGPS